jgi:hypothetical protein
MSGLALSLILAGSLQMILEFGSVTFLLVSLLMAFANYKIHKKTDSSLLMTCLALAALSTGTLLIIYFEFITQIRQMFFTGGLYALLALGAWTFTPNSRKNGKLTTRSG